MTETKKFLIIDGNALVHRAYHALPPLKTKKGELVNAVYGFLLVFLKALKDIKPDYIAATFDLPGPTFRHEQFAQYKAKRVKAPDELYQQLPLIKEVLTALAVPIFEKQGFEADDVIGALTVLLAKEKSPFIESIILTGDMDTLQLVNKTTKVYTLKKGLKDTILYDIDEVKKRYDGLLPEQLQDYRGLRGDASDNIPGVAGIGEKTAIELLKEFDSLDNLYKEIEVNTKKVNKIKPGVLQKLKSHKEQAILSRHLSKIQCEVSLDFELSRCQFGNFDLVKVQEVFARFEFNTLLARLSELVNGKQDSSNPVRDRVSNGANNLFSTKTDFQRDIFFEIDQLESQGMFSQKIAQVERDLSPVISQMEKNGIKVDISRLNELSKKLETQIKELEKKIHKESNEDFNLNSPQQLSEFLFNKLKIPSLGMRKTPGGVISTGADELKKIKNDHPVIGLILRYRGLFKLKSGFADSLATMISPKDGRIHPHFHQMGAETGRMSCSSPNLQNIPVKGELGLAIRRCFVAEKGFQFVAVDYAQVELRIAAYLAHDEKMLAIFQQGEDIHTSTASQIFGIPREKITKEMRSLAKTISFGVLYGMGATAFAGRADISRKQAKEFIEKYFTEFQGIAQYVQNTKQKARDDNFVETLFGRKRFLPEIDSLDPRLRAQAERMAVNLPIQGTAADIMKMAMVSIAQKKIINSDCRLLLQIHDELLFEVREEAVADKAQKIKKAMENIAAINPPMKVKIEAGKNWGEMEKI
ncbi:MAG: DNA polymerase [Candidatus Gribaldobacteria bacterium]|nr:DNA polymerase [Candidatus Gribaldobacteria bacterium]